MGPSRGAPRAEWSSRHRRGGCAHPDLRRRPDHRLQRNQGREAPQHGHVARLVDGLGGPALVEEARLRPQGPLDRRQHLDQRQDLRHHRNPRE
eukprot:10092885-Heterocapsa_arctica.AAC.1